MKYFITGASGFVGSYLIADLSRKGHDIHGVDVAPPPKASAGASAVRYHQMSLMDYKGLRSLLEDIKPDRVIHLASASSVSLSWTAPIECFVNNTNIFLNLVEAIRDSRLRCRVLSVGSSEEYGVIPEKGISVGEGHPLDPASPYAVARVAQEHFSRVYVQGYGLDIVCTRSFNHIGPGQADRFVVSSFVKQAVEIAQKKRKTISCGRIDIVRDFMDVRDVIRAYDIICEKGQRGDVYNVCNGAGYSLKEVLERVCRRLNIPVVTEPMDALMRPVENGSIIGDNRKLLGLGFKPEYDLSRSLDDMIKWWQQHL